MWSASNVNIWDHFNFTQPHQTVPACLVGHHVQCPQYRCLGPNLLHTTSPSGSSQSEKVSVSGTTATYDISPSGSSLPESAPCRAPLVLTSGTTTTLHDCSSASSLLKKGSCRVTLMSTSGTATTYFTQPHQSIFTGLSGSCHTEYHQCSGTTTAFHDLAKQFEESLHLE